MRTIRTAESNGLTIRLLEHNGTFLGVLLDSSSKRVQLQGNSADEVWHRLHVEANKANQKYFGFDGAKNRFLRFFPEGGFNSAEYASEERNYKMNAKAKLDANAPLGAASKGSGFGEVILSIFRATNLLYPLEKTRLQGLLRSPKGDAFVRAAANFALEPHESALLEMASLLKPYDNAKWTVVTYLPFLWRPELHMFLKPEVTQDFAERVGHRFSSDYQPKIGMSVYNSLLDLASVTEKETAELKPRDRIDVQSFIWVVSDYKEGADS